MAEVRSQHEIIGILTRHVRTIVAESVREDTAREAAAQAEPTVTPRPIQVVRRETLPLPTRQR